ncbi:MAG: efflux RND transporter periplasmic adaptor subunit [Flavobacteriales bacterium]|nr:efflux RND transporter periplasmic adaptor subunit [Flavobacteriales bacterium]MDG1780711.1 efflux RND transporter periplasmic adaptor subunit [Flavobacteriales bacterium]MDG2244920.1 efflux RND transporter periplasmic adaptor subunit [Flavobacteriales bacterium]
MKKSTRTILIVIGVLVLLIIMVFAFSGKREGTTVTIGKVENRTIVESVSASGKIQPEVEVKITAEVSGLILQLPVKEGDQVEKGDLLVGINPDIYNTATSRAEAALNTAKSGLSSAKARMAQADAQLLAADLAFARSQQLFDQGAISRADYDQAVSTYEVSKAEVTASNESIKSAQFQIRSAQASLDEALDNLNRTTILAPQSGIVTALTKEVGESVQGTGMMQGETIMKISDLSRMEVNVEVNESDIVRVAMGDTATVEVDAYLDEKFTGVVTEISNTALNALDNNMLNMNQVTNFSVKIRILPESYAHLIEGKPANYAAFRPGMSATVEINTAREEDALSIPIKAVTTRQDTSSNSLSKYLKKKDEETEEVENEEDLICVFVLENGKAQIRVIETGVQDSKYIQVLSGLDGDEEIITGPYNEVSRLLKNGKAVETSDGKQDDSDESSEE